MSDIITKKFEELENKYAKKQTAIKFNFRRFVSTNLNIKRSDVYTHNIHSYPGRLFPYIPILFLHLDLKLLWGKGRMKALSYHIFLTIQNQESYRLCLPRFNRHRFHQLSFGLFHRLSENLFAVLAIRLPRGDRVYQ